jgi:hypothetical protein
MRTVAWLAILSLGGVSGTGCGNRPGGQPAGRPATQTEAPPRGEGPGDEGPGQTAQRGAGQEDAMLERLRTAVAVCTRDARVYLSAEALPQASAIRSLARQLGPGELAQLEPLGRFFVYELIPPAAAAAPAGMVAQAYCAALQQLPAEWWGLPGGTISETGQQLLRRPGIRDCLLGLFDDSTPLRYLDGEARTWTSQQGWTVADLAAGFVATLQKESYDSFRPAAERADTRRLLRASR